MQGSTEWPLLALIVTCLVGLAPSLYSTNDRLVVTRLLRHAYSYLLM